MISNLLNNQEKVSLKLKELYSSRGYSPFKMSKFEEYDLYVENKDFLVSDKIISFTDTSGRLMALKPDVTLSIIKNAKDQPGEVDKLYYNENVYRISGSTGAFKEIMQAGLECVGDVSDYDCYEVICLAIKSLECISEDYVLDVSHIGLVEALFDQLKLDSAARKKAISFISAKSNHELSQLLYEKGVESRLIDFFLGVVSVCGNICEAIDKLKTMSFLGKAKDSVEQLEKIANALSYDGLSDKVNFDLSVINDMRYYSGVAFKGFIGGIPQGILSGGSYDKLPEKMRKKSRAIGFAVYLDLLESYSRHQIERKTVLVADKSADVRVVSKVAGVLREKYGSVLVTSKMPSGKKDAVFMLDGEEAKQI